MTTAKLVYSERGTSARVSVNFRKSSHVSPCMARAQRALACLTVYPPSRTLELLAFDDYCRFDTSAFFLHIKRASLYMQKESRSIKRQYSSKAKSSNNRVFAAAKSTVPG